MCSSDLSAAMVAYDYTNGGQPFTGRDYFIRADEKTVYVLRFRGRRNILSTLRSHTDAIARSFKLKTAAAPAPKPEGKN